MKRLAAMNVVTMADAVRVGVLVERRGRHAGHERNGNAVLVARHVFV